MFLEFSNFIDSGATCHKERVLFVEEIGIEEYFVTFHYLMKALKDHGVVCLVSFRQLVTHYTVIAEKLNLDFKKCMDMGTFRFVDGVEWLGAAFTNDLNSLRPLGELYLKIKSSINELSSSDVTLIVDDLSVLTAMGYDCTETTTFIQILRNLVGPSGMLIVNNNCRAWSIKDKLSSNMRILADFIVTIEPLRTGYCKEISGQVTITWKYQLEKPGEKPLKRAAHYKLTDKTLSIVPIGLSAAVL